MVSKFLRSVLVDPLDKSELKFLENMKIRSDYGREYEIINSIPNLCLIPNSTTGDQVNWANGQLEYEEWNEQEWFDKKTDYIREQEEVAEIYEGIDFTGKDIADIGGHCGTLRYFATNYKNYVIIDPYIDVIKKARLNKPLVAALPFIMEEVDFVCAHAELLPLKRNSFDIAHIRSAIDHFQNPEQALFEAHRILRTGGQLILGTSLHINERFNLLNTAKKFIGGIVYGSEEHDHHTWHPTLAKLQELIQVSGFHISSIRYQKKYAGRVVYIYATK